MTTHCCTIYDCYLDHGFYAFCDCGWESEVYDYGWINDNYKGTSDPNFIEYLYTQYEKYHNKKE